MRSGRRAVMPTDGYRPPRRLFIDSDGCVVRVVAERDGRTKDFDFASLPLNRDLQVALAHAFHTHTGPSGRLKALGSANSLWVHLNAFARILAALPNPPQGPADLKPSHLDEYLMRRASLAGVQSEVSQLMTLLAQADGRSPALAARCAQGHPNRRASGGNSRDSYTPDEERRIVEAARHTVRNAAERIRGNHDLLRRWRVGDPGLTLEPIRKDYVEVMDGVERAPELPRYANGKVPDWVGEKAWPG